MEPITALSLIALVQKVIDFLKYAANRDVNGVVTQLAAWVAGVIVAFVAANADVTAGLDLVGGTPLGALNGWSLVLVGVAFASAAGSLVDYKKARDENDSAGVPPLLATRGSRARRADGSIG